MPRPWVTIHSLSSVDGRLDGFPPDVGLYYRLAAQLPHQAVLSGSGTILAAAVAAGVEMASHEAVPAGRAPHGSDVGLPWLVVVDSRGRVPRLDWLRSSGHWRDVVVLCASATPSDHIHRLHRAGVHHEVIGDAHVDLRGALHILADRYDVRSVRVDAGPGLNGALLRADLVDEVSVVVAPYVAGRGFPRPLRLFAGLRAEDARRLRLISVDALDDDHLWLRYRVAGRPSDHVRSRQRAG